MKSINEKKTITIESSLQLRQQLLWLKKIKRHKILSVISNIIEYNILNYEYNEACELLRITEYKIKEIYLRVRESDIIDITKLNIKDKIVVFSSTVKLQIMNTLQRLEYKIVGEDESRLKDNFISISSPLAYILIGKRERDTIILNTYLGYIRYKIIEIKYI